MANRCDCPKSGTYAKVTTIGQQNSPSAQRVPRTRSAVRAFEMAFIPRPRCFEISTRRGSKCVFPPMPQVCFGLLCVLLILITGCSNPSSQNLASLTVTATPSTVSVGGSAVLKAVAHLSDGTTQDVTSGTQWTLSNTALATMTNAAVTAKAPGIGDGAGGLCRGNTGWHIAVVGEHVAREPERVDAGHHQRAPRPSTNTPTISWSAPAAIFYGTALSSTQLNATASVAGTFTYTPAAGTVLKAGTQTLSVVFTPTDSNTYSSATATVQLTVNQASPAITWAPPAGYHAGDSPQRNPAGRHRECARYVHLQPCRGRRSCPPALCN